MRTEAGKRHRTLLRWRGDVPCRTCGRPHDYRWTGYRATLSTWADPVDGHSYDRMNAAQAIAAERARIRAAVETMPTARIISQWDLISRKAVLAIIDGAPDA